MKARPFERLTINLQDGPVLGAIRREAEHGHLSLSRAGLERSLRDLMRLTARDFALTPELMVGVVRVLCERLAPREKIEALCLWQGAGPP